MMILPFILSALAGLGLGAPAPDRDIKAVYINGSELFILPSLDGQARQVTRDGTEKSLPVWSQDGSLIAFVEGADSDEILGDVVVISSDGNPLNRAKLRRDSLDGMRFIESLEWINRDDIAISGSVNPSLTETVVLNLKTQAMQGGIFDDGPGADFSPDGSHVAYASGSPHFTPEGRRQPALNIDDKRVFPPQGTHVRFVSNRRWSPDSRQLAVVAEDFVTKRQSVVVWHNGQVITTALPLPPETKSEIFWKAGDLFIASGQEGLRVVTRTGTLKRVSSQNAAQLLPQALSERSRLNHLVEELAGRDWDFWCPACSLASLPRKALH
jgi:WD40 repeat protein